MTISSRVDVSGDLNRRVVITGIGMWTPLGSGRELTWQSLVAGRSAGRWLEPPQWAGLSRLAGAPCETPRAVLEQGVDPVIALALEASREAILDAGLVPKFLATDSTGVVFGTSKGSLHTASRLISDRYCSSSPDRWLDVWPNAAASAVAQSCGSLGPTLAPVAACATGLAACLRGFELIRDGRCNVVLAGSSDASLQPAILASFQRLGVLARPSDDPAGACRPFDRDRSGFIVGEGAGCLVLESLDHAIARGARWYAEWEAGRMLSDPQGLTQLDPQGLSLQRLLSDLRKDVGKLPQYMNLHGTATIPNDRVESAAIRAVLGAEAEGISYSSLKGGLGHLLGAAGSVELAASLLAIRDQKVPPTVNLQTTDTDPGLDFTPGKATSRRIDRVWKLSLGFGGHLSAASVCRLPGTGDRTV